MSDEQTIYISRDDDITTVRERLEGTTKRQVTLVIPTETQLRSHVAWKVLHADARRMGKDVTIISPDPQIRSVAQAVKFRVANSLEASAASKSRPGVSRPVRNVGRTRSGGSNSSQFRSSSLKRTPEQRFGGVGSTTSGNLRDRDNLSSQGNTSDVVHAAGETMMDVDEEPRKQQQNQFHEWYAPLPERPSKRQEPASSISSFDVTTTGGLSEPSTSAPDTSSGQYGQTYDLAAGTQPSFRQLSPSHLDEDADFVEDYNQARNIMQSARSRRDNESAEQGKREQSEGASEYSANQRSSTARQFPSVPLTPSVPADLSPPSHSALTDEDSRDYRVTPLPKELEDPYTVMEEDLAPSSLAEQRGVAQVDGLDSSEYPIQDAAEMPTHVIDGEIVDDGDLGDFVQRKNRPNTPPTPGSTPSWVVEPSPNDASETAGPSRLYSNNRPRSSSGENAAPFFPHRDENADELPPVEERPTATISPNKFRSAQLRSTRTPSGKFSPPATSVDARAPNVPLSTKRVSQPIAPAPTRNRPAPAAPPATSVDAGAPNVPLSTKRVSQPIAPAPTQNRPAPAASPARQNPPRTGAGTVPKRAGTGATTRAGVQRGAPTKKLPSSSRRLSGLIPAVIVVLLLLTIGFLTYFLPSANVTIALPATDYQHVVALKAVASGSGNTTTADTAVGERLSNDFLVTGTGKATGTTKADNKAATGEVTFTNNGNVPVEIPSGIVVATSGANGVSFVTTENAVVNPANNTLLPIPISVQAQKPGESGNVDSGAISVIPDESLKTIASNANIAVSSLKLKVVNETPTTGGGAGEVPAVAQKDIDVEKSTLSQAARAQYTAWLAQHVSPEDQASTLSTTETLVNSPTVGQTVDQTERSFTEKLKLSVSVLVVRSATLQHAAALQLNNALKKDATYKGYTIIEGSKFPIKIEQVKTTNSGDTVNLNFHATGKVVASVSEEKIRKLIAGKGVKDAQNILIRNISGAQHVDIKTAPSIGSWSPTWIPFWSGHINVNVVPGTSLTPALPNR